MIQCQKHGSYFILMLCHVMSPFELQPEPCSSYWRSERTFAMIGGGKAERFGARLLCPRRTSWWIRSWLWGITNTLGTSRGGRYHTLLCWRRTSGKKVIRWARFSCSNTINKGMESGRIVCPDAIFCICENSTRILPLVWSMDRNLQLPF